MRRAKLWRVCFFASAVIADRAAKMWALANLARIQDDGDSAFFSLGLYFNRGISFSLLDGHTSTGLFVAAAGIAILALVCAASARVASCPGMPLLWAGAAGNLTDRVLYGYVVDWIHAGIFINLADVWLGLGCLAFLRHCLSAPAVRE
jgi:signal peptidase II